MICEQCGAPYAYLVECRTRYADDSQNVCPVLCSPCEQRYTEYWDDMWAEYYAGLMV